MLSLKPGVKIDKLQPQILLAVFVVHDVYQQMGATCTITSGNDGTHMPGSRHYEGLAVDFRTKNLLPGKIAIIAGRLRDQLGGDFDVVVEESHLHVEFDPKGAGT